MARTAKYTAMIPVYHTPEQRQRIKDLADRAGVSQAEIIRDIIDVGIDEAEARWTAIGSD